MQKKWLVFLAAYLGSIASTINQYKVPPLMEALMGEFQLPANTAGWLMSCFGITGLLLAIPLGIILKRERIKKIGVIGLAFLTIGALLGAVAPGIDVLLLGRALEGLGLLTMGIVAPTIISACFEKSERGLLMGIWATWIPAGSVIIFNLSQPLYSLGNWRAVWWFGFGMSFISLILYLWLVELPEKTVENTEDEVSSLRVLKSTSMKVLKNKELWLLALMFTSYILVLVSYISWAPLYLNQNFGLSSSAAAFYTSFVHLAVVPCNMLTGLVIQRIKSSRKTYLLGFMLLILWSFAAFNLTEKTILYFMLLLGLSGGFISTSVFASVPEVIGENDNAGLATSTIISAQNLGLLIGPAFLGKLYAFGGWRLAGYFLLGAAVVGAIIGWLNKVR